MSAVKQKKHKFVTTCKVFCLSKLKGKGVDDIDVGRVIHAIDEYFGRLVFYYRYNDYVWFLPYGPSSNSVRGGMSIPFGKKMLKTDLVSNLYTAMRDDEDATRIIVTVINPAYTELLQELKDAIGVHPHTIESSMDDDGAEILQFATAEDASIFQMAYIARIGPHSAYAKK